MTEPYYEGFEPTVCNYCHYDEEHCHDGVPREQRPGNPYYDAIKNAIKPKNTATVTYDPPAGLNVNQQQQQQQQAGMQYGNPYATMQTYGYPYMNPPVNPYPWNVPAWQRPGTAAPMDFSLYPQSINPPISVLNANNPQPMSIDPTVAGTGTPRIVHI